MSTAPEKQIILITGATNGVGLDSAIFLANASANNHVVIGARSVSKGETVLKQLKEKNLKGSLSVVELDVTNDSTITAAAKKLDADFGRLDVLINNAGICPERGDEKWPSRDTLRSIFETNVFGPTILTDAVVPLLRKSSNPKIINVTSSLGSIAMQADLNDPQSVVQYPGYRMSKAALNMLTGYQYFQLKDVGAKVWSYCPGYVATDLGNDRDDRVQNGIDSSETSAQGILEIVEGKRDAEVGTFVARYGKSHAW